MRMSTQMALLCVSAALVAAQIPRRAFQFRPNPEPMFAPSASFVEMDDAVFTDFRRRVLASSSQSSRWNEGATDREIGAFALEDSLPPPVPLPMNEGFVRADMFAGGVSLPPREPIRPPSFAATAVTLPPPPAVESDSPSADVLDLDSYMSLSR